MQSSKSLLEIKKHSNMFLINFKSMKKNLEIQLFKEIQKHNSLYLNKTGVVVA